MNKQAILDEFSERLSNKPFLIQQDMMNTLVEILTAHEGVLNDPWTRCNCPDCGKKMSNHDNWNPPETE